MKFTLVIADDLVAGVDAATEAYNAANLLALTDEEYLQFVVDGHVDNWATQYVGSTAEVQLALAQAEKDRLAADAAAAIGAKAAVEAQNTQLAADKAKAVAAQAAAVDAQKKAETIQFQLAADKLALTQENTDLRAQLAAKP